MKAEEIKETLSHQLSPKRYRHSLGVAEVATKLAERYGGDPGQAKLAGLLHDCAKELDLGEMRSLAKRGNYALDNVLLSSRNLLHGMAGSVLAREKYGIEDVEIEQAIAFHTVGSTAMTRLDKIVFLADYIEPSRDFPGVEQLRAIAREDLDRAVLMAISLTLRHLLDSEGMIYVPTVAARNALLERRWMHEAKANR